MAMHPLIRPLGLLFTFSGLAQGVVWIVGSILCILLYTDSIEPPEGDTHSQLIFFTWYAIFFHNNDFDLTVTNHVLFGFAIAYLVLSIWWLLTSSYLFYYIRLKRWKPIKHVLVAYCIIVTFTSIVDVVLMSLLVDDYRTYETFYNPALKRLVHASLKPQLLLPHLLSVYTLTVIGIMIMIAVRGIFLWFFNVASILFAVFLIGQQLENERRPTILYNIPIDAYNEYPSVENPTTCGNMGLDQHDWETSRQHLGKLYKPQVPPKPKNNPLIPVPDYSPPETPKHLRSTNNNNSSYF